MAYISELAVMALARRLWGDAAWITLTACGSNYWRYEAYGWPAATPAERVEGGSWEEVAAELEDRLRESGPLCAVHRRPRSHPDERYCAPENFSAGEVLEDAQPCHWAATGGCSCPLCAGDESVG